MEQPKTRRGRLSRRLVRLLAAALPIIILLGLVMKSAASDSATAWVTPSTMALKRVSATAISQHESNFLNNLDCDLTDYRLPGSDVMQSACFTRTAFGLVDSDNGTTVFNGTDEGLPLLPYSAQQVLVPWPQALDLLTLDSAVTGGSYVGFYKNPLSVMRDRRDWLLKLTAKQLTAPPESSLADPTGKPLVINPQTLAFSDNGLWLVAETLSGAFVRINLATLDVLAFAPSYGTAGSPALLKSQVSVSDDGKYAAIANNAALELKVYDLAACANTGMQWQDRRCAAYDYWPFASRQIAGLQTVRHVRFINDRLLSFEARTNTAGSWVYELSPQGSIDSLIDYLALGDSYTSGEGAFDYLAGTDTADNKCHLSVNSYPLLLTRALYGSSSGHSVACSGATINDVGSTSPDYRGQVRGIASFSQLQQTQAELLGSIMAGYAPGYVAQQRFAKQYQPAVMTVSVGGNDIGFGDILQNCVAPHVSLHRSKNDCYNTYEDRVELTKLIDRTVPRWTGLYKQLAAAAPGTHLYAIGYPQTVSDTGNCALNVHLSQSELGFVEELTDYLNAAVEQAADKAGVAYVDVSQALAGHRLCEAASYDVAVNGLTAGNDSRLLGINTFGHESYHPNALGQALIEQAILKQTHNLAAAGTYINDLGRNILNVPKTGRKINVVMPGQHLATGLPRAGGSLSVAAAGPSYGLKAFSPYSVRLQGAAGRVIATVTSDESGSIAASVSLPSDIETGPQTIDITGENQAGEPVDIVQPIYVPTSDDDVDGDGIPNNIDGCPGAVNGGQDIDRDGIDDACDGTISLLPTIGPRQTGTSNSAGINIVPEMPGEGGGPDAILAANNSPDKRAGQLTARLSVRLSAINRLRRAKSLAIAWLILILVLGFRLVVRGGRGKPPVLRE